MRSRYIYYIPLMALFAVAVFYHVEASTDAMRDLLYPAEQVSAPFDFKEVSPVINRVRPEAEQAGVKLGDRVISINGVPLEGDRVFNNALNSARPGETMTVVVERDDAGRRATETLNVRLVSLDARPGGSGAWLAVGMLRFLMPALCLLLGFWVVLVRPRDPLAWLLLGLLLSFSQFGFGDTRVGSGLKRDLIVTYRVFFISAWPIMMLLFGIYFPNRLNLDRRFPWAKWIFIIPLLILLVFNIVLSLVSERSYQAGAPLYGLTIPYRTPLSLFTMAAISCFFVGIGYKIGTTKEPDARRRLRLLLFGTQIGLAPIFILVSISLIRTGSANTGIFPAWLVVPALLLLFLFPLTLAYVIVVDRAMDVRVVVRQGVQYALARSGVRIIQLILSFIIIFSAASFITSASTNRPQKIIIISVGITFVFLLQGVSERLRRWTDRRFFREAYNAEMILSDLSEKVRTMIETGPLLETVAQRISESLHVRRIALLLNEGGAYRPAYALGYNDETPPVSFTEKSATVGQLKQDNEPVLVYSDDTDSWVNQTPGMDSERAMLAQLETQLLLPLNVKEKLPGFISLGPKQSEEPYSSMDLRLLQSVATQTGLALENSQLTAAIASEVAQRERMNRELEIAREVQERLFPQQLPPVSGLDYCGACRPALGVGGDYYDFLLLPGGNFGIAIGDVSGKGISAALLMASLQASLRGQAIQGTDDLATLMSNVNRLVFDASAENRYATFFYAQYEPTSRRLIYVNAGHNPPIILRKVNDAYEVLRLEEGGVVVGLLPNFSYGQGLITLERGDMLVSFTDGISEAMNTAEEEWGEEKLIEAAQACYGLSASETITRLVNAADAFAAGAKQHDDMTLVIVRVT